MDNTFKFIGPEAHPNRANVMATAVPIQGGKAESRFYLNQLDEKSRRSLDFSWLDCFQLIQ